ncbi:MAG: signal peptidase II [Clostridia bacterium]|nr:signal peptidase II [Clostridia bacterium]
MKKFWIGFAVKVSAIVLMLVIDLLTKLYFQNYFEAGGADITLIENVLGVTYTINTGAAFGIFGNNTVMLCIFTVLFLLVFSFIDFYYKSSNGWYIAGFSLILGGALGNFYDRIVLGGVRDFIELKFIDFPIFNFADVFLTVGVICYIIYLVFYEFNKPKKEVTDITEDEKDGV